MESLEMDLWWPGVYGDVRHWCSQCQVCQGERGKPGLSAWSRTELFSRPFRVLQFDTVSCRAEARQTVMYVLIVVCCFSRWCWLIPIAERTAAVIANELLTQVVLGMAMFPSVLRSNNAGEFVSEVVAQMNRLLDNTSGRARTTLSRKAESKACTRR